MLGGHVRAVFTLVTVIFIVCVTVTIGSFPEIPLWKLEATQASVGPEPAVEVDDNGPNDKTKTEETGERISKTTSYGSLSKEDQNVPRNVIVFVDVWVK